MMQISNPEEWRLQSLVIQYQEYGEFKGKHTAKITFQNKQTDAFTFVLDTEKTQKYLNLIKEEVSASASWMGQKLIQSLNMLPAPTEQKSVIEDIGHDPVTN